MSKLLISDSPMQVLPQLAALIGLNEAIFAQQLKYLLNKSKNIKDGDKWVYNTYFDWTKVFPFWSESTIKRVVKKLEDAELIITSTKYNRYKADKTKWYRLNEKSFLELEDKLPTGQNDLATDENACPTGQNDLSHGSDWHDAQVKMTCSRTGQNDPTYDQEITNRLSQENLQQESSNKDLNLNNSREEVAKSSSEILNPPSGCVSHETAIALIDNFTADNITCAELTQQFGLSAAVAKSWAKVRRSKRAPLTPLAFKRFVNQAKLANLSIEDAAAICAERAWSGFEAGWLIQQRGHPSGMTQGNAFGENL